MSKQKVLPEAVKKVLDDWYEDYKLLHFWSDFHDITFYCAVNYYDGIDFARVFQLGTEWMISIDHTEKGAAK